MLMRWFYFLTDLPKLPEGVGERICHSSRTFSSFPTLIRTFTLTSVEHILAPFLKEVVTYNLCVEYLQNRECLEKPESILCHFNDLICLGKKEHHTHTMWKGLN